MMKTLNTDYDDDGQFLEIHDYFHFDLFLSKQLYDWWVTVNFILVTLRMTTQSWQRFFAPALCAQ